MAHTTLEERLQLQRVFRFLVVDIPMQKMERKLMEMAKKISHIESSNNCNPSCYRILQYARTIASICTCSNTQTSHIDSPVISSTLVRPTTASVLPRDPTKENTYIMDVLLEKYKKYIDRITKLKLDSHDDNFLSLRISSSTLVEVFRRLDKSVSLSEAEDILWEVNDQLNGSIGWHEFQASYYRCKKDQTGLEPCDLYYLICFLMYDKDCKGSVYVDDTMHMMFMRYGVEMMQNEISVIYGDKLGSNGNTGLTKHVLSFQEYYKSLNTRREYIVDKTQLRSGRGKTRKFATIGR